MLKARKREYCATYGTYETAKLVAVLKHVLQTRINKINYSNTLHYALHVPPILLCALLCFVVELAEWEE